MTSLEDAGNEYIRLLQDLEFEGPLILTSKSADDLNDQLGLRWSDLSGFIEAHIEKMHTMAEALATQSVQDQRNGEITLHDVFEIPIHTSAGIFRQGVILGILYSRLRAQELREDIG